MRCSCIGRSSSNSNRQPTCGCSSVRPASCLRSQRARTSRFGCLLALHPTSGFLVHPRRSFRHLRRRGGRPFGAGWLRVTAAAISSLGGVERLSNADALAAEERLHLDSIHIPLTTTPTCHATSFRSRPRPSSLRLRRRWPPEECGVASAAFGLFGCPCN